MIQTSVDPRDFPAHDAALARVFFVQRFYLCELGVGKFELAAEPEEFGVRCRVDRSDRLGSQVGANKECSNGDSKSDQESDEQPALEIRESGLAGRDRWSGHI